MKTHKKNDELAIDNLKINALAMIDQALEGNAGVSLSCAKIFHSLFFYHLKYDTNQPNWINRDRFILSSSNWIATYYAQLRMLGILNKEDLEHFKQNKKINGLIQLNKELGIEATISGRGQGIGIGVGLALAEVYLNKKFKEIDHYTYVLCDDVDLQEGSSLEALSFASNNKLNKLIIIHESNGVQIDSYTSSVYNEDNRLKYQAMGLNYILVSENSVSKIVRAIKKAKKAKKPTIIEVKTKIAENTKIQDTSLAQHIIFNKEEISDLKTDLKFKKADNFDLYENIQSWYEKRNKRNQKLFSKWNISEELTNFLNDEMKINLNSLLLKEDLSTRDYAKSVVYHLGDEYENIILGNADVAYFTKIQNNSGTFAKNNKLGRNLLFGARELAMGFIANGIALHSNLKPIVSTFLSFSNQLLPAILNASLMNLKVLYIFLEDPNYIFKNTYHPEIEMLRMINNINILRPADEVEMKGAFEYHFNQKDTNTNVILMSSFNKESIYEIDKEAFVDGAYYVLKSDSSDWTLISSGDQLIEAYKIAKENHLSLISISNFNKINELKYNYQKTISIEQNSVLAMKHIAKYNIGYVPDLLKNNNVKFVYEYQKENLKETIQNIINS
ncbi:hypothetical protein [[Mycoplasma] anseris]|nr:hypothetical protein [[Mycoplasma] anseris]